MSLRLKTDHKYDVVVFIGDGATDLQARPPADAFIGFGGVVSRPIVQENADWFVTSMHDLVQVVRDE